MVKSEHLSFPCEVEKEKEVDGIFSNHHGLPRNIPVYDGLPRNIHVSDGVPRYTPYSCTDGGLAYGESARTLHTQPSLDEGSTTIRGDTPSSSRLKAKPHWGLRGSIPRGYTSRNEVGVRLHAKKPNRTSSPEGTSPIRRPLISRTRTLIDSKYLLYKLEEVVRLYLEGEEGDYCATVSADCQSEYYRYEKKNEVEEYTGEFRIDFKFSST